MNNCSIVERQNDGKESEETKTKLNEKKTCHNNNNRPQ